MLTLVFEDRPWSAGDEPARVVNQWQDDHGRAFAVGKASGEARWIEWMGRGLFRFDSHSTHVSFHPEPGVDRASSAAFFHQVVQPIILQAQGTPVLHASAAIGPEGAIALCGLSGSGKSTLAYALDRMTAFTQVADDAVVLRADPRGEFLVTPLPFRRRLRESASDFFRAPALVVESPVQPDSSHARLRAIVVLTQESDATSVATRITPSAAFSALLAHAHCFDESDRDAVSHMVQSYLSIAETVPVFRLTYRPDFDLLSQLVATIAELVTASPWPR